MKGILLVNGFIKNAKFSQFYNLILSAFKEKNIELEIVKSTEINLFLNEEVNFKTKPDFILFFDKDIALAKHLENLDYKVFNSSSAIQVCEDKGLTHLTLENYGIKMPKTRFAQFSYHQEFVDSEELFEGFNFPLIVKERIGSLGEQVYLLKNKDEFEQIKGKLSPNILIQEYLNYHYHEDIRVYVVNHQVVGCTKRIGKENDFRANSFQGGTMQEFKMDSEFISLASKISKILNLDYAGLDFILDNNNKPIFIEANSNAQFLAFYKQFKINIASFIADYILNKLNVK